VEHINIYKHALCIAILRAELCVLRMKLLHITVSPSGATKRNDAVVAADLYSLFILINT
jgi:hypothetical protein